MDGLEAIDMVAYIYLDLTCMCESVDNHVHVETVWVDLVGWLSPSVVSSCSYPFTKGELLLLTAA